MLVSPGMIDVLNGTIDDGWGGLIGWMWVVAAISTLGLLLASRAALREPLLLRGDGDDRPALPRDPHRVRHRRDGPRRIRFVTIRRQPTARLAIAFPWNSAPTPLAVKLSSLK